MAEGDNNNPTTPTRADVDITNDLAKALDNLSKSAKQRLEIAQQAIEAEERTLQLLKDQKASQATIAAAEAEFNQNRARFQQQQRELRKKDAEDELAKIEKNYAIEQQKLKELQEELKLVQELQPGSTATEETFNNYNELIDEATNKIKKQEEALDNLRTKEVDHRNTIIDINKETEKQSVIQAQLSAAKEEYAEKEKRFDTLMTFNIKKILTERVKSLAAQEKKIRLAKLETEQLRELAKAQNLSAQQMQDLGLGIKTTEGELISQSEATLQASGAMDKMGGGMGKLIMKAGPYGVILAALGGAALFFGKKVFESTKQLQEQEVAMERTTGVTGAMADAIQDAAVQNQQLAVSLEESYAQAKALTTTFTDFTGQTTDTANKLVRVSGILSRFGMTAENFAQSMQISTKAMGMSAEGAAQNLINLEQYARDIGVPFEQLSANFAQAGNMMAKMGTQGTQSFRDLSLVAKRTGMDLQRLIAITEQFDTFEGAATAAGKLNAALGVNFVNAMDLMMEEDPAQRFMMIRDAIMQTGLTFDDMTYKQKLFFAQSAGLQDVSELSLLMSGRMDLLAGATNRSAQSYEEAAQRAADLATFQEQMNKLMANMSRVALPLVEGLNQLGENMGVFSAQTSGAHHALAVEQHSPTFLDTITHHLPAGLKMTSQMMDSAATSTQRMTTTVRQGISGGETSLPNYAQTMVSRAEAPISAMNQAAPGRNTSSTVSQQPITVQVGDKPLVKMVLDTIADHGAGTIGNMIKNINQ